MLNWADRAANALYEVFVASDASGQRPAGGMGTDLPARRGLIPDLPNVPQQGSYYDLIVTNASQWDVVSVQGALNAHDNGMFTQSALLADYMMRDGRISSSLQTRTLGLQGLPFSIDAEAPEEQDPTPEALEQSQALAEDWQWIFPEEILAQVMRWSRLMGFALCEIVWDTTSGKRWIPTLKLWHPQYVYYRLDTRKFHAISGDGDIEVNPGDGKWFLYCPQGAYRGWITGSIRALALPFMFRQLTWRDWARYNERHGLPVRQAIVPPNASSADKKAFFAQIAALGAAGAIMAQQGTDGNKFALELIECANTQSWEGFERAQMRADAEINLEILGQNGSGGEMKSGSYAQAKVAEGVRDDFKLADAVGFARQLRMQVVRPWSKFNFGDGEKNYPKPTWDAKPPEDKSKNADVFLKVMQAVEIAVRNGADIDNDKLIEGFALPLKSGTRFAAPQPAATPANDAGPAPNPNAPPASHSRARIVDPTRHAIEGQLYVDDVAARATKLGAQAIAKEVIPVVMSILQRAKSLEQVQVMLVEAFPRMEPVRLRKIMASAIGMSSASGLFTVNQEAQ